MKTISAAPSESATTPGELRASRRSGDGRAVAAEMSTSAALRERLSRAGFARHARPGEHVEQEDEYDEQRPSSGAWTIDPTSVPTPR